MKISQARLDANRRNAQRSTGPRTAEGKAASRANSLKHGLCSSAVQPEDASVIVDRARDFYDTLRPQNHFHCWIVSEVALITWKIDRCERMDRRARDKLAIRAELGWDDRRRLEAELLGEQLANRPAVVVGRLRETPQGCDWLMARWAMLAYAAEEKRGWTPAQEQLAFDLLATPGDFRQGHRPGVAIDAHGRVVDPGLDPATVARREIDALAEHRESVEGLDEANRALAMADLDEGDDAELRRLRKYEGSFHSRLRWCMAQLQKDAPARETPRWLKQSWLGHQEARAEEAKAPEVEAPALPQPVAVEEPPPEWTRDVAPIEPVHPPFDLEPGELPPPGVKADYPQILSDRRARKLKVAEGRREARRRKVERLLG